MASIDPATKDNVDIVWLKARRSRTLGEHDWGHAWLSWRGLERGFYPDFNRLPNDLKTSKSQIDYLGKHKVRGLIHEEPRYYATWRQSPWCQKKYGDPVSLDRYASCQWTLAGCAPKALALLERVLAVSIISRRRPWGWYSLDADIPLAYNCVSWSRKLITKVVAWEIAEKQREKVVVLFELIQRLTGGGY